MTEDVGVQKEVWIEPEIKSLDVIDDTHVRTGRGRDGFRYVDCTRS